MIEKTEKETWKKKMLNACIAKQQDLINDFNYRIKLLLENEDLGNEEEYDNTVLSQNSQKMKEVNALNEALKFANEEMGVLHHLAVAHRIQTQAELGAVVITDRKIFFVCVSIEEFQVEGKVFVGISMKSPLFLAMQHKKKGDEFEYNNISYAIKDIF
jgi:hypothetical protein